MKQKVFIIILLIFIAGLMAASIIFFQKNKTLTSQLDNTKQLLTRTDQEVKRVQAEKEKMSKDNEKLQTDAASYLEINNDLQKENQDLDNKLTKAGKMIKAKEESLKKATLKLEEVEKKIAKEQTGMQEKLIKEKKELEEKVRSLEETLQKERALFHYNLAVNYAQSGLYDEAVEAYEKSLTYDPKNADAHYNLGLLYGNLKSDGEKAILHYRKYLELKPKADDREEVLGSIEKLK